MDAPDPRFARLRQVVLDHHRGFGVGPDTRFGIRFDVHPTAEPAGVTATWTAGPAAEGPPGVVHGGVQGILVDALAGWSTARWQAETGAPVLRSPVTADLHLRFRRPLPIAVPLRLSATVTAMDGPRLVARVHLGDAAEPRRTEGTATYHLLDRTWFPNPYLE